MNTTSSYLYEKIVSDIIDQLNNGSLHVGDKLPTEIELAKSYSVSRITVTKAMNILKQEGYLIRFPNRGTFVSEDFPRVNKSSSIKTDILTTNAKLNNGDTHNIKKIAFLMPVIEGSFCLNIIRGLSSVFSRSGFGLLIMPSEDAKKEEQLLQFCMQTNVDGIILFPVNQEYYSDNLLSVKLSGLPFVLIDRELPGIDTDYIISDNVMSGFMCAEHLYNLGHKSIAFVSKTSSETYTVNKRIQGLLNKTNSLMLPSSNIHIIEQLDINQPFDVYTDKFKELIEDQGVTAFVLCESEVCIYIYNLLKKMDYSIPEDISMISFDNPINSSPDFDFFTHIDQSEYLMACDSANLIIQRMQDKSTPTQHKVVTPKLEIRRSTSVIR